MEISEKYIRDNLVLDETYIDEQKVYRTRQPFSYDFWEAMIKNLDKIDEYERVGIIRCPLCKEVEVTEFGDDEYLPNLRCCACNHVWLANGELSDENNLINELKKLKEIRDKIKEHQKTCLETFCICQELGMKELLTSSKEDTTIV